MDDAKRKRMERLKQETAAPPKKAVSKNKCGLFGEPDPKRKKNVKELGLFETGGPEDPPKPRIQSEHLEGSDPQTFKIGDRWERWGSTQRQAIPHARWSRPGQEVTPQEDEAYSTESRLWMEANFKLESVIRRTRNRIERPQEYTNPQAGNDEANFNAEWKFLIDLWKSRGMTPPSEQQLVTWAFPEKTAAWVDETLNGAPQIAVNLTPNKPRPMIYKWPEGFRLADGTLVDGNAKEYRYADKFIIMCSPSGTWFARAQDGTHRDFKIVVEENAFNGRAQRVNRVIQHDTKPMLDN